MARLCRQCFAGPLQNPWMQSILVHYVISMSARQDEGTHLWNMSASAGTSRSARAEKAAEPMAAEEGWLPPADRGCIRDLPFVLPACMPQDPLFDTRSGEMPISMPVPCRVSMLLCACLSKPVLQYMRISGYKSLPLPRPHHCADWRSTGKISCPGTPQLLLMQSDAFFKSIHMLMHQRACTLDLRCTNLSRKAVRVRSLRGSPA